MDYAGLVAFLARLEGTSGRLEMTRILLELLGRIEPEEARPAILLLQGAVAPDWEGLEVGLAEKQVLRALAVATGRDPDRGGTQEALAVYHEEGDLGIAAERLLSARGGARQAGLMRFAEGSDEAADGGQDAAEAGAGGGLSVTQVHERLAAIAGQSGQGSQERKARLLQKLLADVGPAEAKYLVRTVMGRLRLGVADMTVLDALAHHEAGTAGASVQDMEPDERGRLEDVRIRLERAYDLRSDLGLVARTLLSGGMDGVDGLGIEVGVPLRPMAAERLKTLPEVWQKQAVGGGVGMEYKYDGLRMQAHVAPDGVRIFSRRLEDLTAQFPDVVAAFREALPDRRLVVEGEAVALDASGRMRPFQDISRRRGRKTGLGHDVTTLAGEAGRAGYDITQEIPVTMFLFDVLLLGQDPTLGEPLARRRAILEDLVPAAPPAGDGTGGSGGAGIPAAVRLSTFRVAHDVADMEAFFQEAVEAGAEGIMCKQLDAPYKAGSRGFAWIKFKTDYTEALVDTMDLVCIGAFHGRGRRAGWYGALLMAAYDAADGTWRSVCKLGTGFDDETLTGLKDRFAEHVAPSRPPAVDSTMEPDVWLEPVVVMEVQAAELSLSPVHRAGWGRLRPEAGIAARFPRFTRWRDDKGPEQATTVDELAAMYAAQGIEHGTQ